jgi:hypothetical protein
MVVQAALDDLSAGPARGIHALADVEQLDAERLTPGIGVRQAAIPKVQSPVAWFTMAGGEAVQIGGLP